MRRLTLLVLAILLVGCASPPPAVEWPREPMRVVFQILHANGFPSPVDYKVQVPEVTLFGDGRILVRRSDADGGDRVYQSFVSEATLAPFMARAHRDLTGTGSEHVAMNVTDAGATWFSVATNQGSHTLKVIAFSSETGPSEQDPALMNRLRSMRLAALALIESDAQPFLPDQALLISQSVSQGTGRAARPWPDGVVALPSPAIEGNVAELSVSGPSAQALINAVPIQGPWLYTSGGQLFIVRVVPVIPLLGR